MESCSFCRIVAKRAPAKIVYEDDLAVGLRDANPQAPVHLLVIPRRHLRSLADAAADDAALLGHLLVVASQIAREAQLEDGYRVVINTGHEGGQTVFHLHVHVIGGRAMRWPPG